jgi:acetyl-CoA acetyltransferase
LTGTAQLPVVWVDARRRARVPRHRSRADEAAARWFWYEQLGLAEKGGGPELIASGRTRLDGDLPVNTSGGLLSKGHPIGATGIAQVC